MRNAIVYERVVIHILLKCTGYAISLEKYARYKPLLDIHDGCLHMLYTCDDIMYPFLYLLID